ADGKAPRLVPRFRLGLELEGVAASECGHASAPTCAAGRQPLPTDVVETAPHHLRERPEAAFADEQELVRRQVAREEPRPALAKPPETILRRQREPARLECLQALLGPLGRFVVAARAEERHQPRRRSSASRPRPLRSASSTSWRESASIQSGRPSSSFFSAIPRTTVRRRVETRPPSST